MVQACTLALQCWDHPFSVLERGTTATLYADNNIADNRRLIVVTLVTLVTLYCSHSLRYHLKQGQT
jgi:hypothetical protein